VRGALLAALGAGALLAAPLPQGVTADRLLVDKSERTLTLFWHGVPLKTYRVALGGAPNGPKEKQGDERTPEGVYHVDKRLEKSAFHRGLRISYPNREDRAIAREAGVHAGGDIAIHGLRDGLAWVGSAHTLFDWTDGCIAVTNEEIDELWRAVPKGTEVEIRP
jgi:murein L,D-transpeptidase YafK